MAKLDIRRPKGITGIDAKGYQFRLVAFIDILGFKEMLKNEDATTIIKHFSKFHSWANQPSFFESIAYNDNEGDQASNSIQNRQIERTAEQQNRKVSVFSDLVVISYLGTKRLIEFNFSEMLDEISFIQQYFIQQGIPIRGGITYGELCHDNELCFGPGLVRAHELEKSMAFFPRIIIDPKISNRKPFRSWIQNLSSTKTELFSDGYWGVNHLDKFLKYPDLESFTYGRKSNQMEPTPLDYVHIGLSEYKAFINKGLVSEPEKYSQLKDKYAEVIKLMSKTITFDPSEYGDLGIEEYAH